MPLLDHFHPPLGERRGWEGFHGGWAHVVAADLNSRLPEGWYAESRARFGIEIDVATFDARTDGGPTLKPDPAAVEWSPKTPALTIDFPPIADAVEVLVFNRSYDPDLVGAIEFVSPANKDRPDEREAFAAKCETILRNGAGLLIVDVVTNRRANLHRELLGRIGSAQVVSCPHLYATAYRPTGRPDEPRLEIWEECLSVGSDLPTVPLFLRVGPMMPIDLNATYLTTCRQLRLPAEESGRPTSE